MEYMCRYANTYTYMQYMRMCAYTRIWNKCTCIFRIRFIMHVREINVYVCTYTHFYGISVYDSTENATPSKSTKSINSNSSVQIQIEPQFQFEFVPRDTEESEFLD